MSEKTAAEPALSQALRKLYVASAVLMIVGGIGGLVLGHLSSTLYASGVPSDAAGYLQLFSQHQTLAAADWTLWIAVDLAIVLPSIALYFMLRNVNKTVALAGTLLSLAYIAFDIAATELSSLKLVSLSQSYVAATGAAKASVIAQASNIVNALPLMTFFSFTVGAVGWLLWSVLMPKTFFRKTTAIFGVVVNVIGFLGGVAVYVPSLGLFNVLGAILTALWFLLVGTQMLRHTRRFTDAAAAQPTLATPR